MISDNNAAAGSVIESAPRAPAVLALLGSFWRPLARAAATCWIERASSAAKPAGAPSRKKTLPFAPDVAAELASFRRAPWQSEIPGAGNGSRQNAKQI